MQLVAIAVSLCRVHNKSLETNRRPALPLHPRGKFASAVHDAACLLGGGRSALR